MQTLQRILVAVWNVTAEMAPYLLLGFVIAALLWKWIRQSWVERHLTGPGPMPSIKASVFGVPLPLCSCGVIPVSASLRRHGASKGATSAFLMATPQTGVDSIFATYALLGPVLAVIRPIAALLTGVIGGTLIDLFDRRDQDDLPVEPGEACDDGCGAGEDENQPRHWPDALRYGLVTLPGDIGVHLLIGIVVAGLLTVLVPEKALEPYLGSSLTAMAAMLVVGIPLYVCSTGSIPMALAFIHMGVTPGAALVFLVAGPATNAATIAVTWKVLGKRTTVLYLIAIFAAAIVSGLALDFLATYMPLGIPSVQTHDHPIGSWIQHVSGVVMLGMLGYSLLARWTRIGKASDTTTERDEDESAAVLHIEGMNCSHCADAAERALREVTGVRDVNVDLNAAVATVRGEGFETDRLRSAVDALGYKVTSVA